MTGNINEELAQMAAKIEAVDKKIDGQKKRDSWDKLQILASFISSILFAGVGLYFTTVYNNREAKRQDDLQKSQLDRAEREEKRSEEMQKVQKEINQLQAIIQLTPLLASKDTETRYYARITLEALRDSNNPLIAFQNNNRGSIGKKDDVVVPGKVGETSVEMHDPGSPFDLLQKFGQIVLGGNVSIPEQQQALKNAKDLALEPGTSPQVKSQAATLFTKIAVSEKVPAVIRSEANEYLKDVIGINRNSFASYLEKEKTTRAVKEIVLHHTYMPSLKTYRDAGTIKAIANVQIKEFKWEYAGWHYMIAPDGLIWTGRPLDINFAGVQGNKNQAVSITLLLNGDEELPTDEQKKSIAVVINALDKKFNIDPLSNFSPNTGFHRDYNKGPGAKTCPGKLITKEMVLGWLGIQTSLHK